MLLQRTILLTALVLATRELAQAQVFQDAAFASGWNDTMLPTTTSTTATCTAAQDTANGNGAPSRTTTHTYTVGHIDCAHVNTTATYNPATQGAIAALSYSYDLIHYTTPGAVRYSLLALQNNTYYYVLPDDLISGGTWQPFSHPNLTAANFTKLSGPSSNAHPDFSCAGAPITFGYVTRNTNTIAGKTDTTKSGIDNWNVSITATPCCVARPANMVAWWQLNEPNGATVVNDIAGFNNQGIPKPAGHVGVGGPNSVPGMVQTALYFARPYLEVAPQAELDFGTADFTIDAWVRPVDCSHGGSNPPSPIVDKFDGSSTGFSFYLSQPAVGVGRVNLRMNSAPAFTSTGPTIPVLGSATWSHVAVTVARPSAGPPVGKFYINGLPAGTFTPPVGNVNNPLPLWIGKVRFAQNMCEIAIDELELFNRALSQSEIKSIVDARAAGKCP